MLAPLVERGAVRGLGERDNDVDLVASLFLRDAPSAW